MNAKEFIHRIIQFVFDTKVVDSYVTKRNPSAGELTDIRINAVVVQWYATQMYISARAITDKLSEKELALLAGMYESHFLTADFKPEETSKFKSELLLKMEHQKDHYDSVYPFNRVFDITGHNFIGEIGEIFAKICNRSDSVEFKRLGSDLFGSCLNKCINEFKFVRIEFKNLKMKITKIEGIGQVYADKFKNAGVVTIEDLLVEGGTKSGRKNLAEQTGIEESKILTWVNMADLFRIKGVGSQFSELLHAAGVDTVKELKTRNAENLHARLVEVQEKTKITRAVPTLSQVSDFVSQSGSLPPIVTH
jgi:predicted flap endonuclease-1-like 5' DNA nuclease